MQPGPQTNALGRPPLPAGGIARHPRAGVGPGDIPVGIVGEAGDGPPGVEAVVVAGRGLEVVRSDPVHVHGAGRLDGAALLQQPVARRPEALTLELAHLLLQPRIFDAVQVQLHADGLEVRRAGNGVNRRGGEPVGHRMHTRPPQRDPGLLATDRTLGRTERPLGPTARGELSSAALQRAALVDIGGGQLDLQQRQAGEGVGQDHGVEPGLDAVDREDALGPRLVALLAGLEPLGEHQGDERHRGDAGADHDVPDGVVDDPAQQRHGVGEVVEHHQRRGQQASHQAPPSWLIRLVASSRTRMPRAISSSRRSLASACCPSSRSRRSRATARGRTLRHQTRTSAA